MSDASRETLGESHQGKTFGKRSKAFLYPGLVFLLGVVSQSLTFHLIPAGQMDDAGFILRAMRLVSPVSGPGIIPVEQFVPGWPVLLSLVYAVTGDYNFWGRVLTICCTSLAGAGLFLLFQQRGYSLLTSSLLAWLFFNSPKTLELGSSLMTEPCSYFAVIACLLLAGRDYRLVGHALLGGLAGWCATVRPEGLLVGMVLAVGVVSNKTISKASIIPYLLALFGVREAVYASTHWMRGVHGNVVLDYFKSKGASPGYLLDFFAQNSQISCTSLLGWPQTWLFRFFWPLLLIGLVTSLLRTKKDKTWRDRGRDSLWCWVLLYGAGMSCWPFFSDRYWPLWAAAAVGLSLEWASRRVRIAILVLVVLIQLPSAVAKYRLGPTASQFSRAIYVPFYQEFHDHEKVMSLYSRRVQLLGQVSVFEPLQRTDFQSIPIAMAHFGCSYIEWENYDRTLASFDGAQARPYPPQANLWLKASTLFEPHHECGFSTCYRLKIEPERLKRAGSLYSQAMQTPEPSARLAHLEAAHQAVSDLPELRVTLLAARAAAGQPTLDDELAYAKQYAQHSEFAAVVVQKLRAAGRDREAEGLAKVGLEKLDPRIPKAPDLEAVFKGR